MPRTTAKIFRNGRNQAIRIPVEFSFSSHAVTIEKRDDALIIRPEHEPGWDQFFADSSLVLPEDFEIGEDPPPREETLF